MEFRKLPTEVVQDLDRILGYLNFSSGNSDSLFLAALNRVFGAVEGDRYQVAVWPEVVGLLRERLEVLRVESPAFQDSHQAAAVLDLLQKVVLPGYRTFHADLLYGVSDAFLFRPFFLGRVWEAIIRQGGPWDEAERISRGAIKLLNDFIGHRPLPALESQKIKPYEREWVRPIPWYVRSVGVGVGKYHDVIELALDLLRRTDPLLLEEACFDPELLDELAVDPRPYDFDHPANKRPNYHFGQWDPHHLDQQGRYRRFVVQEVTLQSLWQRVEANRDLPESEVRFEAAAVLAGTMLMAAGVSGRAPETHDSSVTLGTLLPKIAAYRDRFYERLIEQIGEPHGSRLKEEAASRRQPFGGARQHLNAQLARRRAEQLEHVHLAWIYSRMGYTEDAARHVACVAVPSARMLCQIECCLTAGWHALEAGRLADAVQLPGQIVSTLRRAIECGAVVDPWNILGFDCHFSLFPALENSIHDHRIDALVGLVEEIQAFYARLWSDAAARDEQAVCLQVSTEFESFAAWWRKFAAHEVQTVETTDALEEYRAAEHVARALNLWQKGGAAAGDVAFWAPHAAMFGSPKAYALVVDALLDRRDHVASMALIVHWLGQSERVPLEHGEDSFFRLLERWVVSVMRVPQEGPVSKEDQQLVWQRIRKMFDYLEANADAWWRVPDFALAGAGTAGSPAAEFESLTEDDQADPGGDALFDAAYEDMVYHDTTDDGVEGEIVESGDDSFDELERESRRVVDRLAFLTCLARLWRIVVLSQSPAPPRKPVTKAALSRTDADSEANEPEPAEPLADAERLAVMQRWIQQAEKNRAGLARLLESVKSYQLTVSSSGHDAMVEYDRKRVTKEALLDDVIATAVDTANAIRVLEAMVGARRPAEKEAAQPEDQELVIEVIAAMMRGDLAKVRRRLPRLRDALEREPLLYVPLARGGEPSEILETRIRQACIYDLLAWLPRFGLLSQTCELIECARRMERDNPVGAGAVTEFDELFKMGYEAIVENMILSAKNWTARRAHERMGDLVASLEKLTETMLMSWLTHSKTLRLSVLERVSDRSSWNRLVEFIRAYGHDLFTQRFLNLGNLRAILHQGIEEWLERLNEDCGAEDDFSLRHAIDKTIPRRDAVDLLSLVLEAIVENYSEYRDYNSTTTQSDRGEMLFSLLDFLRLRTKYDRICWNLRPVIWAHEMLVRQGLDDAARLWRRSLKERTHNEAEQFVKKLHELQQKYAMQMPSVAERVGERFLQSLYTDRIRALIGPAIREAKSGGERVAIEILRMEIDALTTEPRGSGLDTPSWLVAIEEEVERARRPEHQRTDTAEFALVIPRRNLSLREIQRQINSITEIDED